MENSTQQQPAIEPAPDNTPDLTGTTLGDFQILRRLGQGGMGQVYLAEQISLKRKVALKLLRKEMVSNPTALQRFEREAKLVAQATHANIVQVYFIGEDKGLRYMALEYVDGRSLRDYLEKKGPPEILVGISIMRQVAAALQRASELGIIHRDIKPDNILLTRKSEVKVADFGLSLPNNEDRQQNLTQTGVTMGTPLYMAPEQVEGKPVDPRTDIYSFGVTCYHMFAGHPPFRGATPLEVAYQHVHKEPVPLREIRPDLPPDLCAIIHKMMAKKPEERYQTAREIVRDLVRLRDLLVGVASPAGGTAISVGTSIPAGTFEPSDSVKTQPLAAPPYRPAFGWLLVGVAVLMLIAGGALGLYLNRDDRTEGTGLTTPGPGSAPENPPSPLPDPRKEQEERLLRNFKPFAGGVSGQEINEAMRAILDLGLFYLEERKLAEAEKFFQDIQTIEMKSPFKVKLHPFRQLGNLGQAMILAFKGAHEESNQIFLRVIEPRKEIKPGLPLKTPWLSNGPLRRMMAEALRHNKINSPTTFPLALEPFLSPPPPVLRSGGGKTG